VTILNPIRLKQKENCGKVSDLCFIVSDNLIDKNMHLAFQEEFKFLEL
jgi:hypothetical protein